MGSNKYRISDDYNNNIYDSIGGAVGEYNEVEVQRSASELLWSNKDGVIVTRARILIPARKRQV